MAAQDESYSHNHVFRPLCKVCKQHVSEFKIRGTITYCLRCDPQTKELKKAIAKRDEEYRDMLRKHHNLLN